MASRESRKVAAIERIDRFLRSHPAQIGALVVVLIVAIALVQDRLDSHHWLIITYAVPVTLAAYSIGALAGVVSAFATSALLVLHASRLGLTEPDALLIVTIRLGSNLVIAGLGAIASAAARARDAYLEQERQTAGFRRDLVAAFTHDLRSPLAAIVGYASMLREETVVAEAASPTTTEMSETLDRIEVNARRMNDLVGDILSTEQSASAGATDVAEFAAAELVAELRDELDAVAARQPGRLTWMVEPGTPPLVTDRAKLISIVRNLVGNALKYGGRCWIRVTVGFDTVSGRHRIEVSDTGPGIPPDKLAHLFDRFYRGSEAGPRAGGFGLGLFIVRSLTRALGGEIAVESEPGRGTKFSFSIPRGERPRHAALAAESRAEDPGTEPTEPTAAPPVPRVTTA
jgi:signal transduction histidine kinase